MGEPRYVGAVSFLDTIERIGGARPTTCPWQAYSDPDVVAVLDMYNEARIGDEAHVASLLASDPPNHVYEGVKFYAQALRRARSEAMRRANDRREQARRAKGNPLG